MSEQTTQNERPRQWRYNGRYGVSNRRPHHCLLNRLFRRSRLKKTSKLRVIGLCAGTAEFPAQMASYTKKFSIWWRHHDCIYFSRLSAHRVCESDSTLAITLPADGLTPHQTVPSIFWGQHSSCSWPKHKCYCHRHRHGHRYCHRHCHFCRCHFHCIFVSVVVIVVLMLLLLLSCFLTFPVTIDDFEYISTNCITFWRFCEISWHFEY